MAELFVSTLTDEIACVRREIEMREWVYPRRVADGKMNPVVADRELATMRSVLARLENLKRHMNEAAFL